MLRIKNIFLLFCLLLWAGSATAQNIVGAEYYIDTDPGIGAATAITIPTPGENIQNLSFSVPTESLSKGFHRLFVRVKDANGVWSHSQRHLFFKEETGGYPAPYKVKAIEYFIDADPGKGAGTLVSFTATDQKVDLAFTVDIAGVSNGFHTLTVRAIDENNAVSVSRSQKFFKETYVAPENRTIDKVEYFIDADPGKGKGIDIAFSPGENIEVNEMLTITGISNGFHYLNIRARDNKFAWSPVSRRVFFYSTVTATELPNLVYGEYFFDADPGKGKGIDISLPAAQKSENFDFIADVSSLTKGFHTLSVRVRDANNRWSIANTKRFYKDVIPSAVVPNLAYAEYFFDADLGRGKGIAIPISETAKAEDLSFVADVSSLSNGFHSLNIRVSDKNGNWSVVQRHNFFKDAVPVTAIPDVAYAEYYIDEDPGAGKATQLTGFTAGANVTDWEFTIPLTADISNGFHNLYVRTRDSKGKYSTVAKHLFFKDEVAPTVKPNVTKVEYFINTADANNDAGLGKNNLVADLPVAADIQNHIFTIDLTDKAKGTYYLVARAWNSRNEFSYTAVDTFKVCDNVAKADFAYEPLGLKVEFTDISELPGTEQKWLWKFGNGATSTQQNPTYTYTNGTYNVCLTVSNDCNSSTICKEITVSFNNPPTAASKSFEVDEGKEIVLKTADLGYADLDGNSLKKIRIWNPTYNTGDSLVVDKTILTANMEIAYADIPKIRYKPGVGPTGTPRASFGFYVYDGIDWSANQYLISFTMKHINQAPTFDISTNTINVLQNSTQKTITDWITNASDNDADEEQSIWYEITENGASNLFDQLPNLVNGNKDLTFVVKNTVTGVANFTVKMTDQSNYQYPLTQSTSKSFTIAVKEFKAALAADKQEVCTGDQVTFTSSSPTDGITFAWEFGTGATPSTFGGAVPPPVVYATGGTKTIKLTITAGAQTDFKTIDITVLQSPNAEFTTETDSYALNSEVTFTNSSVAGQTYEWDWGDGTAKVTTTDLSDVKHTFNSAGETKYTVTLKVTNGICIDVFSKELNFVSASPPNIIATSFTEAINDGQTKTISVQASDQKGLLKAIFYYKGISETAFKSKTLNTLNSLFETDLTQAMGDEIGITYYFDVYNIVGLKTKSAVGNTYINYNKGVEVPFLQFGVTVDKYQIVSMPLKLKDNKVSAIFNELGEYDKSQWRLLNYSPDKLLEYQTDFDVMDRGKGYWFIARNSTTLNTGEGATADPGSFTEFEIALRKGWTQIGNPYNFDVSWSDIKIHNPTASSFIENLKEFRNGSFIESNTLKKFSGGFVYSSASGVTLKIPLKKASNKKSEQVLLPVNLEGPDWNLNLNLQNGSILNTLSGIGMNKQANSLHDEFDQMAVPRFIQYLEGVFVHPDAEYKRFAKDVVPTSDSHVWEFIVSNTFENELVTLNWNELLPGNNKLILFDVTNQRQVDMQTISSYTFNATESRVFKIFFGTEEVIKENLKPELYFLGQAYPNPSNGLTYIPFTVPESDKDADVELSIYDMVGKKIATVVNGKVPAGFHEAQWNGLNYEAKAANSGMYMYKLTINNRSISLTGKLVIVK